MRFLYDICFIVFSIFYLPYFLLKGKYHKYFLQRFGIFKKDTFSDIAANRPVWLHAVSMGEMKAAEAFVGKIRGLFPSKRFVISNITTTGHETAVSIAKKGDVVIYFPMDLSFIVRRLVSFINPAVFIAIETEIWPNLISELHARGIPVVLMNGKMSERSFRIFRLIKPIISRVLNKVTLFCMRSDAYAERIKELGALPEKVKVTGNMKFDSTLVKKSEEIKDWAPLREKNAWLPDASSLMIAASTHHGEDEKVLRSYKSVRSDFPDLVLLIAPRHIERVPAIEALAKEAGFKTVRISELEKEASGPAYEGAVFILDSIGHLNSLYKLATIVFMGGSLFPYGGHNFIEPAALAKPIITGPHAHNFKDVSELFARNGAMEIVRNDNELAGSLKSLLSDGDKRKAMGEKAKELVLGNIGAADKNLSLIKNFL